METYTDNPSSLGEKYILCHCNIGNMRITSLCINISLLKSNTYLSLIGVYPTFAKLVKHL